MLSDNTYQSQKGHTDIKTIAHLSEIGGTLIKINFWFNLGNTRQGVHHNHLSLGLGHHLDINNIGTLDTLILCKISESLLLDTSDIDNIRFANDIVQVSVFGE